MGMNSIVELVNIIKSLGGSATIDEIKNEINKKYKDSLSSSQIAVVEDILSKNTELVVFNKVTKKWQINEENTTRKKSETIRIKESEADKHIGELVVFDYCCAKDKYEKRGKLILKDGTRIVFLKRFGNYRLCSTNKIKGLNLTDNPSNRKVENYPYILMVDKENIGLVNKVLNIDLSF